MRRRLAVVLAALALGMGVVATGAPVPAQADIVGAHAPSWGPGFKFSIGFTSDWNSTGCDRLSVDATGLRLIDRSAKVLWSHAWPPAFPGETPAHVAFLSGNLLMTTEHVVGTSTDTVVGNPSTLLYDNVLQLRQDGNLALMNKGAVIAATTLSVPCPPPPTTPTWTSDTTFHIGQTWWNRLHCDAMWVDNYGLHIGDANGHVLWDALFQYPNNPGWAHHPYVLLAYLPPTFTGARLYLMSYPVDQDGSELPLTSFGSGSLSAGMQSLVFQDDGNLVLKNADGTIDWSSHTPVSC